MFQKFYYVCSSEPKVNDLRKISKTKAPIQGGVGRTNNKENQRKSLTIEVSKHNFLFMGAPDLTLPKQSLIILLTSSLM